MYCISKVNQLYKNQGVNEAADFYLETIGNVETRQQLVREFGGARPGQYSTIKGFTDEEVDTLHRVFHVVGRTWTQPNEETFKDRIIRFRRYYSLVQHWSSHNNAHFVTPQTEPSIRVAEEVCHREFKNILEFVHSDYQEISKDYRKRWGPSPSTIVSTFKKLSKIARAIGLPEEEIKKLNDVAMLVKLSI